MSGKNLNEDTITRIFDQLNDINRNMSHMNVTLAKQEVTLTEHIRRTALNEKHIEILEERFDDEIAPIKTELAKLTGVIKFVAGMIAVIAMAAEVIQAIAAYAGK